MTNINKKLTCSNGTLFMLVSLDTKVSCYEEIPTGYSGDFFLEDLMKIFTYEGRGLGPERLS